MELICCNHVPHRLSGSGSKVFGRVSNWIIVCLVGMAYFGAEDLVVAGWVFGRIGMDQLRNIREGGIIFIYYSLLFCRMEDGDNKIRKGWRWEFKWMVRWTGLVELGLTFCHISAKFTKGARLVSDCENDLCLHSSAWPQNLHKEGGASAIHIQFCSSRKDDTTLRRFSCGLKHSAISYYPFLVHDLSTCSYIFLPHAPFTFQWSCEPISSFVPYTETEIHNIDQRPCIVRIRCISSPRQNPPC
mmetsp:Transcript_8983/g.33134  ORF Transcript_8983/g.33134 Transcript_8983/m.33134 type:complete len:244 (+) Transcript_8983:504-1235(+)